MESNDFVFDAEVIAQAVAFRQKIVEIPAPARYFPDTSSVNSRRAFATG